MRYKPQQSNTTKCLNSCDSTIAYFRKRPIVVCILITVMLWMFLAIRWSSNRSFPSHHESTKPISRDIPPELIREHPIQQEHIIENDDANAADSSNDQIAVDTNDMASITEKVSNAKKVVITYGQNCCANAKVCFISLHRVH